MPIHAERVLRLSLLCLLGSSSLDILAASPREPIPLELSVEKRESGPRIGKFEVLATHVYLKNLRAGRSQTQAKERGIIAAVMGARARGVKRGGTRTKLGSVDGLETKVRSKTLTAKTFDEQVAAKMGPFFSSTFLPLMEKMVDAGLSYEEVKQAVNLSPEVGAKISGAEFERRAKAYLQASIPASRHVP